MKKLVFIAAAGGLMIASCARSGPTCATPDAQGIVTALQPEQQFRSMLRSLVERTQTAGIVRQRDGAASDEAIAKAVDHAVMRHRAAWQRNLVTAWNTLGPSQIEQACNAMADRDQDALMRLLTRVGPKVQQLNEPVLKQAGAEVLAEVW